MPKANIYLHGAVQANLTACSNTGSMLAFALDFDSAMKDEGADKANVNANFMCKLALGACCCVGNVKEMLAMQVVVVGVVDVNHISDNVQGITGSFTSPSPSDRCRQSLLRDSILQEFISIQWMDQQGFFKMYWCFSGNWVSCTFIKS